jgi:peptidoglycan/xylan/chitin deacetylase (PgdA/CDA1 family)
MKERLLFALSRRVSRKSLRILAYHGLWTTPGYQYGNHLFMSPERFEQRMIWLKNSCYPVLPLGEAVDQLERGSLPDNAVVITIDDGWSSTYSHMLPVLEKLSMPATVYITTWYSENQLPVVNVAVDYILRCAGQSSTDRFPIITEIEKLPSLSERGEALRDCAARFGMTTEEWWEGRQFHVMSTAEIRDADRRGLDIQLHTHRHRSSEVNSDYLEQEIADNRAALARACGRPEQRFGHFCYPSGVAHASAGAILKDIGVRSATLVDEGINPPGVSPYRLRRFLDGRSVSPAAFEAYLSGAREFFRTVKRLATAEG